MSALLRLYTACGLQCQLCFSSGCEQLVACNVNCASAPAVCSLWPAMAIVLQLRLCTACGLQCQPGFSSHHWQQDCWWTRNMTCGCMVAGDEALGVPTPQKTAMRSSIPEEPEEEDAAVSGARPQVLSASACQQVRPPLTRTYLSLIMHL